MSDNLFHLIQWIGLTSLEDGAWTLVKLETVAGQDQARVDQVSRPEEEGRRQRWSPGLTTASFEEAQGQLQNTTAKSKASAPQE